MDRDARIFVAGHRGLLGSALARLLAARGHACVLTRTREELDLREAPRVLDFFLKERPQYVFLAAARVGGIEANRTRPAEFVTDNLLVQTSVLRAAHAAGVRRLVFFGSTCLYPRDCPQPMREEYVGTGPLEPTSEAYAAAKSAGLAMCRAFNRQYGTQFLTVIPATLYGPHDNFDPEGGHVLSSLLARFHAAKGSGPGGGVATRARAVTVWGTGRPVREFLYVDDLADACLLLMSREGPPPESPINVGTGQGTSVRELAEAIRATVGFDGELVFDPSRPDGAPEKVLECSRMKGLGWAPRTPLREGLCRTYEWFLKRP